MERACEIGDQLGIVGHVFEAVDRDELAGQVKRDFAERGIGIERAIAGAPRVVRRRPLVAASSSVISSRSPRLPANGARIGSLSLPVAPGNFGAWRDLHSEAAAQGHADGVVAYPAGQRLARHLRRQESAIGLVYPSVRHAGGTCLAAFYPDLVQALRQGSIWRLQWRGSPEPAITRT